MKKARIKSGLDAEVKKITSKERILYAKTALQMYDDYEQMVFNLSEQSKNETVESVKNMTVGQRMKFQQLIIKRNKLLKKGNVR